MAKVIIFGIQDFAELAHYYLTTDTEHSVVAFSVNKDFIPTEGTFRNLPVVAFEDVEKKYDPKEYAFFAPMSPKKMNKLRESVYLQIKEKGYKMISYISSKATVCDNEIGDNCFILEDNTLQPFTKIGNNVVLWSGNHIGHHGEIRSHVSFTSHVVMSGHCLIKEYSFIGVNASIRDGIIVEEGSFIAMDASVTKNTEPWGVYMGVPAAKKPDKFSHEIM
jgi:sugar O-acyltransferase (sialic acid O-acetyltransferase NeuD family)